MSARNPIVLGAALIMSGMAMLGFTDNFVPVIAAEGGVWQFHLLRTAMALPLLAGAAACSACRCGRGGRAVAVRCAVQAAAMLLYFGSLPLMPIAQAGAALFTAPIWVLLFSAALLRAADRAAADTGGGGRLRRGAGHAAPGSGEPQPGHADADGGRRALRASNLMTREWCADEPVGGAARRVLRRAGDRRGGGCCSCSLLRRRRRRGRGGAVPGRGWAPPRDGADSGPRSRRSARWSRWGSSARGYQTGETSLLAVFEYSFLVTASFWAWVLWGERLDGRLATRHRADRRLGRDHRAGRRARRSRSGGGVGGLEAAVEALARAASSRSRSGGAKRGPWAAASASAISTARGGAEDVEPGERAARPGHEAPAEDRADVALADVGEHALLQGAHRLERLDHREAVLDLDQRRLVGGAAARGRGAPARGPGACPCRRRRRSRRPPCGRAGPGRRARTARRRPGSRGRRRPSRPWSPWRSSPRGRSRSRRPAAAARAACRAAWRRSRSAPARPPRRPCARPR